jgi:hypothetical protein
MDPNQEVLDSFLNDTSTQWASLRAPADDEVEEVLFSAHDYNGRAVFENNNGVRVDITLRTQIGQAPLIMLLITFVDRGKASSEEKSASSLVRRVSVNFEIGPNGRIVVTHTTGLSNDDAMETDEDHNTDEAPSNMNLAGLTDVQKKLARVLEISEDLGVLVEWILQRIN